VLAHFWDKFVTVPQAASSNFDSKPFDSLAELVKKQSLSAQLGCLPLYYGVGARIFAALALWLLAKPAPSPSENG